MTTPNNIKELEKNPVDEAKKLLEQEKADRKARTLQRIQQILEEEQCVLAPVLTMTESNYKLQVMIETK